MKLATFLPPGASGPLAGEIREGCAVAFADGSTVKDRLVRPAGGAPADGELRQDSNTNDLIFGIGPIVAALWETADLRPGDVILTGTPSGIGESYGRFLESGDSIRVEIEGLGAIQHTVVPR